MSSSGDLRARLIGSFYFVPLLAAMIFGYPLSALAGCIAIGWVAYEAVSILTGGRTGWSQRLFWLVIVLAFGIVFLPVSSVWMALIGAGLWAAAILLNNRREPAFVSLMVFASASLGAMLAKENGHLVLICLAAVISAGDVGAYISGRVLGGPKLAPQISPFKNMVRGDWWSVLFSSGGRRAVCFVWRGCISPFGLGICGSGLCAGTIRRFV